MRISIYSKLLVITGLAILLFFSLGSLSHQGPTIDEPVHFAYGVKVLQGLPIRASARENSTMPVSALNSLLVQNTSSSTYLEPARYATVFFLCLLALLVFCWGCELYGVAGGLFSLFLFCLDPNLIAHGHLVTTDIYAAFGVTASLYSFWRFLKYGGISRAFLSAVIVGASQLMKYTSLWIYVLLLMMIIIRFWTWAPKDFRAKINFRSFLKYFILFAVVSLFIINAGFCFNRPFVPLKDYQFQSHSFQSLQKIQGINSVPLPLPYPFIQGLDLCEYVNQSGDQFGNIYLRGRLHGPGLKKGFKSYYLMAMLYKVPLATLFLLMIALVVYFFHRRYYHFRRNEAVLLLPPLLFLIYCSFFINANVGIRHILLIFPLLYVFCGSLMVTWRQYSPFLKTGFLALMGYLFLSVLSYFPHFISYFNELVPDRKMSYKVLVDSNLDWGGKEWYLTQYIQAHPESILRPEGPRSGRIIVDVNNLVGVYDPEKYRWLRDHFKPVDQIAYAYLVFDVPI
ncbi:MAG: glycosyltransferase family 39 protein [Candidatus Omnitrophica bacterium]|nr:glycosyltransferase family 39 protein [Candidatus Omnitrophota bacterium]